MSRNNFQCHDLWICHEHMVMKLYLPQIIPSLLYSSMELLFYSEHHHSIHNKRHKLWPTAGNTVTIWPQYVPQFGEVHNATKLLLCGAHKSYKLNKVTSITPKRFWRNLLWTANKYRYSRSYDVNYSSVQKTPDY